MFQFVSRILAKGSTKRQRRPNVARLCVEMLEDRVVPSQIWTVKSLSDDIDQVGTLRYIMMNLQAQQNGLALADGDTIQFTVPRLPNGTIKLLAPIETSLNLTIGGGNTRITIDGKFNGPNDNVGRHQAFVFSGTSETITDITFQNCLAVGANGGAIQAQANLTLANCRFDNNQAIASGGGGRGGAVAVTSAGTIDISGCSFVNNQAGNDTTVGFGGAVYISGSNANATVIACQFGSNRAWDGGGGAINFRGDSAALGVQLSRFAGNRAANGGAILTSGFSLTIGPGSCEFTQNIATLDGGAINTSGTSARARKLDFHLQHGRGRRRAFNGADWGHYRQPNNHGMPLLW